MFRIFTIIKKEFRDLVRDRRTMFFMVVFPAVILPLLIGGMPKLIRSFTQKEMDKILTIAIIGKEFDSELVEFLKAQDKITVLTNLAENELEQQILDEEIDGGIVIPNNMMVNLSQKHPL